MLAQGTETQPLGGRYQPARITSARFWGRPVTTLSIIVACLNEEANLEATVSAVTGAARQLSDHQILIFDDASTDSTGAIADRLANGSPKIEAIHNPVNRGFGYNFHHGVKLATLSHVVIVPGDNEISAESYERIFALTGQADLVIAYPLNPGVRPWHRRALSWLFVRGTNFLFRCKLRYYNGPVIYRRDLLDLEPITDGFAFQATTLVRLIRSNASFVEEGMSIKAQPGRQSSAVRVRTIAGVLWAMFRLTWQVHARRRWPRLQSRN